MTVAVHTDVDREALHVREAHQAYRVESYLDIDEMVRAAQAFVATHVHPGYGFLSERAEFVRALDAAGLVLVGPSAEVMEAMGRKDRAREVALAAGVPVVPSYAVEDDPATFEYPVLVKAAAGGGGKGMRVVRSVTEFEEAIGAARREAAKAFGDDTMLVEKYVERGRHIEVQVIGDHHGSVCHLFERDCSTQRRHQKVLEEAPAPTLTDEQRARDHPGRGRPGPRGGIHQRRHRGVPARFRDRPLLLPRDEHPPPGRAPGDRGGGPGERPPHRPGGAPASGRDRTTARVRPGRRHRSRGMRSRPASTPRTRTPASSRRPGGPRSCAGRPTCAWTTRWSPVRRSARPTTRCSARSWPVGADRDAARRRLVDALDRTAILGLTTNTGFLRCTGGRPAVRRGRDRHGLAGPEPTARRDRRGGPARDRGMDRRRGAAHDVR